MACKFVYEIEGKVEEKIISGCVGRTLEENGYSGDITVVFVSSDKIRQLNKEFRGINSATDCLSFENSESYTYKQNPQKAIYLGEIVVCLDKIRKTAQKSFLWDICHVVVHGVFHLIGTHHEHSLSAYKEIHKKEVAIIDNVFRNIKKVN